MTAERRTLWWWNESGSGQGLVVSARLDTNGVAATHDPNDLVGRALVRVANRSGDDVTAAKVVLQGRGLTERLVTAKQSSK